METYLVVQWLRLCVSTAGGLDSLAEKVTSPGNEDLTCPVACVCLFL